MMKKYSKHKPFLRKSVVLTISIIALFVFSVGASFAYLIANTDPVVNEFTPGKVTCKVEETLDGRVKKDVKIKNTGNTDAYIRAMVNITWKSADGKVYGASQPVEGTDYTIVYATDTDTGWTYKDKDGFWYYNTVVAPDDYTNVLIESCKLKRTAPEGYYLSVEILADAVQENAVANAWTGYLDSTEGGGN